MGEEGEEKLLPPPPPPSRQNKRELCSATELLKFNPDLPSPSQSNHSLLTTSLRPPDFLGTSSPPPPLPLSENDEKINEKTISYQYLGLIFGVNLRELAPANPG